MGKTLEAFDGILSVAKEEHIGKVVIWQNVKHFMLLAKCYLPGLLS